MDLVLFFCVAAVYCVCVSGRPSTALRLVGRRACLYVYYEQCASRDTVLPIVVEQCEFISK